MTDTVLLPRSVVEALVDATILSYVDEYGYCSHCGCRQHPGQDGHDSDCPVRITQEALQEQNTTLTPDEHYYLRSMVITWIDEGFTRPPYDAEVYGILQKLGITQADLTQGYDITPPPDTSTRT